jgi:hypothetical protein
MGSEGEREVGGKRRVGTKTICSPRVAKSQWGWASWVMSPDFSH